MCRADEQVSQQQGGSREKGQHQKKNGNKESHPLEKEEMRENTAFRRRGKRVKQQDLPKSSSASPDGFRMITSKKKVKKSGSRSRHEGESQSGGIASLLPSFVAVLVLSCGFVAKMGFRGRATVAGIDLGTTNSVICVQQQSKGKNGE